MDERKYPLDEALVVQLSALNSAQMLLMAHDAISMSADIMKMARDAIAFGDVDELGENVVDYFESRELI